MPDLCHDFPIAAPVSRVFAAITTPAGLDAWWTLSSTGEPVEGSDYGFHFGPGFDWRAVVRRVRPDAEIEWEFTEADEDWRATQLRIRLEADGDRTQVRFDHRGWPEDNDHYRTSSFCWAMYLRLLRRHVEFGEVVPYAERLDV